MHTLQQSRVKTSECHVSNLLFIYVVFRIKNSTKKSKTIFFQNISNFSVFHDFYAQILCQNAPKSVSKYLIEVLQLFRNHFEIYRFMIGLMCKTVLTAFLSSVKNISGFLIFFVVLYHFWWIVRQAIKIVHKSTTVAIGNDKQWMIMMEWKEICNT